MTLQIKEWQVSRLREYPNNPRINDHAVDNMVAAIREFGFRVPIIIKKDGEIVDGHLRLKAARALKLKKIPVVLADDLSLEQIKALRLLINRSAEWAKWDKALLVAELTELKATDYDLSLTGFEDAQLVSFLAGPTAPGEFPEVGEDIETEHACPKCGYRWSGRADASAR